MRSKKENQPAHLPEPKHLPVGFLTARLCEKAYASLGPILLNQVSVTKVLVT